MTPEGSPRRFAFGMAQMFLAGTAAVLLLQTGVTVATIVVACLATSVMLVSPYLFRRRR